MKPANVQGVGHAQKDNNELTGCDVRHGWVIYRVLFGWFHLEVDADGDECCICCGFIPFKTVGRTMCWLYLVGLIIFACSMLGMSFKDIGTNEVGLYYNDWTNNLKENVMQEGRHSTNPWNKVIKYSSIAEKADIDPVHCLSKDGVQIILNADVKYFIVESQLYNISLNFKDQDGLKKYVKIITTTAIRHACSSFLSEDFYIRREAVDAQLEIDIKVEYARSGGYVDIDSSQLKNIQLPEALLDAIESKQNKEQQIARALEERIGLIINANNELRFADITGQELTTVAEAEADANLLEASVHREAILEQWNQVGIELGSHSSVENDNPEDLENYLLSVIIASASNTLYIVTN